MSLARRVATRGSSQYIGMTYVTKKVCRFVLLAQQQSYYNIVWFNEPTGCIISMEVLLEGGSMFNSSHHRSVKRSWAKKPQILWPLTTLRASHVIVNGYLIQIVGRSMSWCRYALALAFARRRPRFKILVLSQLRNEAYLFFICRLRENFGISGSRPGPVRGRLLGPGTGRSS